MNNNLKARGLALPNGENSLQDNVPIRLNNWAMIRGSKKDTNDTTKTSLIKFRFSPTTTVWVAKPISGIARSVPKAH